MEEKSMPIGIDFPHLSRWLVSMEHFFLLFSQIGVDGWLVGGLVVQESGVAIGRYRPRYAL